MKKLLALLISLALLLSCIGAFAEDGAPSFERLAGLQWEFSSGAGGWSTELTINPDGSFSGRFHDSEMGEIGDGYPNGTVYVCAFTGQMSGLEAVDGQTWRVKVDSVTPDEAPGRETIDDGIRYVTSDPYGVAADDEMLIYLPGTPLEGFTEEMRMWAHLPGEQDPAATLEDWFLYSPKNDTGFVGYPAPDGAALANPWRDLTGDELARVSGMAFGVPEGAEGVVYRWLESEGLAEMQFTMDGDEYCARAQSAELSEGELMNISGMYFQWDHEEAITVNDCPGTLGLAQTGSEDWVELCQWYDAGAKRMYSLSVYTTDPDGLDLTAVAQMVHRP